MDHAKFNKIIRKKKYCASIISLQNVRNFWYNSLDWQLIAHLVIRWYDKICNHFVANPIKIAYSFRDAKSITII